MEQKINIAELLKNTYKGILLYSPICGHCKLYAIIFEENKGKRIIITPLCHNEGDYIVWDFDFYGRMIGSHYGECLLFPSEDCRTWEHFKEDYESGKYGKNESWEDALTLENQIKYLERNAKECEEKEDFNTATKIYNKIHQFKKILD